MKLRKALSIVLSVALLLGSVSMAGILPTFAETTFTKEALTSGNQIAVDKNLLAIAGTGAITSSGGGFTNPGRMLNGNLGDWTDWNSVGSCAYMTIDLGEAKEMNAFDLAGLPAASYPTWYLPGFSIYVVNDDTAKAAVYQGSGVPVVSIDDSTAMQNVGWHFELSEPVTGRYVILQGKRTQNTTFDVFWITHIAAGKVGLKPYTVTGLTESNYTEKIIASKDNILVGKTVTNTFSSGSSAALLTNGEYPGLNVKYTGAEVYWKSGLQQGGRYWLQFDMGKPYDFSTILIHGANNANGFMDPKIFVGNDSAATIAANMDKYTPVYTYTGKVNLGQRIDFDEPVTGRYLSIEVGAERIDKGDYVFFGEVAALGEEAPAYREITFTNDKKVAVEDNLLAKDGVVLTGTNLTGTTGYLVDGLYSKIDFNPDDKTTQYLYDVRSISDPVWLCYDLGGDASIESFVYNPHGGHGCGVYELYVTDVPYGEITTDPVYASGNDIGNSNNLVKFSTPVEGRYVSIKLTPKRLYDGCDGIIIGELAVTGTSPDLGVAKRTKITADNIPTGNLLANITPVNPSTGAVPGVQGGSVEKLTDGVYPRINSEFTFATNGWDTTGDPVPGQDGKYFDYESWKWVKVKGATNSPSGYNHVVFNGYEKSTMQGLTFDLGKNAKIDRVAIGSVGMVTTWEKGKASVPKTEADVANKLKPIAGSVATKAKVFVGDDPATLYDDANLVLDYDYGSDLAKSQANFWDFDETATGRYVGFMLPTDGSGFMYVGELGVFGELAADYTVTDVTTENFDEQNFAANTLANAVSVTPTVGASNVSLITDGMVVGVDPSKPYNTYSGKVWYPSSSTAYDRVVFDMGGLYTFESFALYGSGVSAYGANGFKIFVTNDPENVGDAVYETADNVWQGRRIDMIEGKEVEGRYVVVDFGTKHNGSEQIWISEFAAVGTKSPLKVEVVDVTTANYATQKYAENLLAKGTASADATSKSIGLLTDGTVTGCDSTLPYSQETAYLVWDPITGDTTTNKVVFDMGKNNTAKFDSFSIYGSGNPPYGTAGFKLYITDDLDNLGDAIYETTDTVAMGRRLNFSEEIEGRYLVVVLGGKINANKNQYWISEIGATGTLIKPVKHIVCVGDSITEGCHDVSNGCPCFTDNYAKQLCDLFNANDPEYAYTFYNAGISGSAVVGTEEITGTDNALSWMNHSRKTDKIQACDILTIMLGTNDACNATNWTQRSAKFKANYKAIVDAYRAKNPDVEVYIVTAPYTTNASYQTLLRSYIVPMEYELADELDCYIIDNWAATEQFVANNGEAAFIDAPEVGRLGVHPCQEGHDYMAQVIYEGIVNKAHYVKTTVAKGAQIRGDADPMADQADLRFGFTVACTGVEMGANYAADYTNGKYTVNDVEYDIVGMGALVARGDKVGIEDLALDAEGKTAAGVNNVYAAKLYDAKDDEVTFTAVVVGIPNAFFDTQIIARGYVAYTDGDNVYYAYTKTISRSLSDLFPA